MNNSSAKTAIKDWPKGERPRDKLIQYGAEVLSDAEIHAILFCGAGAVIEEGGL